MNYSFYEEEENTSWSSNRSLDYPELTPSTRTYISVFIFILVLTALFAMVVNGVVFASVHWVRRPMPPILKMSLSLAASDAVSSSIFAVTLFINTYLPVRGINVQWLQIVMEMVKLSGMLITVTHLVALSLNHYIGILKPLHYNAIVTRRKVTVVTISMWVVPTLYVVFLFTTQADASYWSDHFSDTIDENKTTFIDTFRYRMSYSAFFIVSVCLMAVCYTHILIAVRRQQNVWKTLSRVGSTKWSGRAVKHCNTNTNKNHREQKQLEGNIRAIYTTLLIMGSCVIGWTPALLIFVLMCKEDCYIHGDELNSINDKYLIQVMTMRLMENLLVILKMLVNPIIYSIRMKEIQDGTKRMQSALTRVFCPSRPDSGSYTLASRRSPNACNSSLRTRLTTSINNGGGASSHITTSKSELVNTLL